MQLLKITSVPIKIKMNSERAKLQIDQELPQLRQKTSRSRLSINTQNIKVRIDTYQARKRLGNHNVLDFAKEAAQKGVEAARAATADYSELGSKLAQAYKGVTIPDAVYPKLVHNPVSQEGFVPSVGAELSWEGGTTDIQYKPSTIENTFEIFGPKLDYIPVALKFEVEQYPGLQIEYLGSPTYVPPSSDPDKELDPDTKEE